VDRDPTNNNVSNLRYVNQSENLRNSAGRGAVRYEYVDTLPEEAVIVEEYGNHRFENLFYVPVVAEFYYFNGVQYRRLHRNVRARDGSITVWVWNTQGQNTKISLAKYRRMINDMP
jgi:hypothetical protein